MRSTKSLIKLWGELNNINVKGSQLMTLRRNIIQYRMICKLTEANVYEPFEEYVIQVEVK